MARNIIITCGISLTENLKEEVLFSPEELDILDDLSKYKEHGESLDIDSKIDEFLKRNEITELSAEFNIIYELLDKGEISKSDNIFLYTSETELGKRSWEIIKERLKDDWFKNVTYKVIEWFVVKDIQIEEDKKAPNVFRNQAIPNFFEKLEEIKENWNETIMCPVGWYKSLIPYSSLYAMVNWWEIKYIYEDSDAVLDLPSWSLTNLTAESILDEKIDVKEIFSKENLSNNYPFDLWLRLIFWIKNFITYWKSRDLSEVFAKIEKLIEQKQNGEYGKEKQIISKLKKYLENLSDAFDLIRLKDIKENIKWISEIETGEIKDVLLKNAILFLQKELKKVNISKIVDWYFERQRYAETILIMREWIIDFVGKKLDVPYEKRNDRIMIENSLKLVWNKMKPQDKQVEKDETKYKYLPDEKEQELCRLFEWNEDFWSKLTKKRNHFAHTNPKLGLEEMKNGIIELYNKYKDITSKK